MCVCLMVIHTDTVSGRSFMAVSAIGFIWGFLFFKAQKLYIVYLISSYNF